MRAASMWGAVCEACVLAASTFRGRYELPVSLAAGRHVSVVVASTLSGLQAYVPLWDDLAANCIERNVFYEAWMLLPALEYFGRSGGNIRVAMVVESLGGGGGERLLGLFPLEMHQTFRGLPIRGVQMWCHPHCYLTAPLIRRGEAECCWQTFFKWLKRWQGAGILLEVPLLPGEGPLAQSLVEFLCGRHLPVHLVESGTRALLQTRETAEQYIRAGMSRETRRSLERKKRRLAERGRLTVRQLPADEPVEPWIEQFIQLEARGWKGNAGTALAKQPVEAAFFRRSMTEAHRRGELLLLSLELNGKPLAMQFNVLRGTVGFALKTTYDEHFSAYSPGAVLELDARHAVLDGKVTELATLPRRTSSMAMENQVRAGEAFPGLPDIFCQLFADPMRLDGYKN